MGRVALTIMLLFSCAAARADELEYFKLDVYNLFFGKNPMYSGQADLLNPRFDFQEHGVAPDEIKGFKEFLSDSVLLTARSPKKFNENAEKVWRERYDRESEIFLGQNAAYRSLFNDLRTLAFEIISQSQSQSQPAERTMSYFAAESRARQDLEPRRANLRLDEYNWELSRRIDQNLRRQVPGTSSLRSGPPPELISQWLARARALEKQYLSTYIRENPEIEFYRNDQRISREVILSDAVLNEIVAIDRYAEKSVYSYLEPRHTRPHKWQLGLGSFDADYFGDLDHGATVAGYLLAPESVRNTLRGAFADNLYNLIIALRTTPSEAPKVAAAIDLWANHKSVVGLEKLFVYYPTPHDMNSPQAHVQNLRLDWTLAMTTLSPPRTDAANKPHWVEPLLDIYRAQKRGRGYSPPPILDPFAKQKSGEDHASVAPIHILEADHSGPLVFRSPSPEEEGLAWTAANLSKTTPTLITETPFLLLQDTGKVLPLYKPEGYALAKVSIVLGHRTGLTEGAHYTVVQAPGGEYIGVRFAIHLQAPMKIRLGFVPEARSGARDIPRRSSQILPQLVKSMQRIGALKLAGALDQMARGQSAVTAAQIARIVSENSRYAYNARASAMPTDGESIDSFAKYVAPDGVLEMQCVPANALLRQMLREIYPNLRFVRTSQFTRATGRAHVGSIGHRILAVYDGSRFLDYVDATPAEEMQIRSLSTPEAESFREVTLRADLDRVEAQMLARPEFAAIVRRKDQTNPVWEIFRLNARAKNSSEDLHGPTQKALELLRKARPLAQPHEKLLWDLAETQGRQLLSWLKESCADLLSAPQ